MKFTAAILTELNKPLIVDTVELTKLLIGQILVRVAQSGICGAQLQEIAGEKGNGKFLPHLVGHEGVGYVEDIGPGVTKVQKGDKVVLHWRKGSGIEAPFPIYKFGVNTMSSGKVTTLSQYSVVSENRITPIHENISNNFCTLLGCGATTAFGAVNYDADIKFGEIVLIIGGGGVGLNLILANKLAASAKVFVLEKEQSKRALIEKNGGIFISSIDQLEEKIDCIFDTVGNMTLLSTCLKCLSEYGRIIIICQPKAGSMISFDTPAQLFYGSGITIRTTQGGNTYPDRDISRYAKLFAESIITPDNVDNIITHTVELENINTGIDILKSGQAGRIMVRC